MNIFIKAYRYCKATIILIKLLATGDEMTKELLIAIFTLLKTQSNELVNIKQQLADLQAAIGWVDDSDLIDAYNEAVAIVEASSSG